MNEGLARHTQGVQRAAGFLAAHQRGDGDGARALLESFEDVSEMAAAFVTVAQLVVQLHTEDTGEDPDTFLADLALHLAVAAD